MSKPFRSSRDVIIQTRKWDEAIEFYRKTLGFPVTHQSPTVVGFETGSFCLYVEKGTQSGAVFDFLVPDLQAAKKHLVAAGCKIIDENPKIPRCYIQDPFGLVFNIEENAD
jgi:predicted enzyme related to lactoylglutathione lyase